MEGSWGGGDSEKDNQRVEAFPRVVVVVVVVECSSKFSDSQSQLASQLGSPLCCCHRDFTRSLSLSHTKTLGPFILFNGP